MATKRISITAEMGPSFAIKSDIRGHNVVIDQPTAGGGTDLGPTPLEYFLFSLAGCVGSIARIAAAQQKLDLRGMRVVVEGDLNPAGLLGKPSDDRVGFQTIEISAEIDADMSDEAKQAFLDEVCARCPLHDNIHYTTVVVHELSAAGCIA
ncbi:OsmC family protein [Marinobacterium sp. YM272]|uniref:OsmC family protein n=1 Tax=Marinobacterium sp. YM272 TaxID=3421654 RepID=UPI003D7F3072